MQSSNALIDQAQIIRQRLRYPPNAVPDRPIEIERVRGVTGYEAQRLAAQKVLDDLQKKIDEKAALLREIEQKIEHVRPGATTPITAYEKVSIKEIQLEVSRQWSVDILDILSRRRTNDFVLPRQVAMVIAKKLTRASYPEIGRRFGNRDHTTVLYAVEKFHWLADALDLEKMRGMSLEQWVSTAKQLVLTRHAKNG